MSQKTLGTAVPTASIAVNKGRLKVYNKKGEMPTYYLQKGQEFQIELFNPTTDNILAKIELNGKSISQGGLVLRPGQRVFLERFLDVEKKFLFDTYEVANTEEVKAAIANNGDLQVKFYREKVRNPILLMGSTGTNVRRWGGPDYHDYNGWQNTLGGGYSQNITFTSSNNVGGTISTASLSSPDNNAFYSSTNTAGVSSKTEINLDSMLSMDANMQKISKGGVLRSKSMEEPKPLKAKSKRSIETGRVEEGSRSDQKLITVNKEFDFYAFHTVEYKMLPISQKVNTTEDINVKKYCTNCGAKLAKGDKFCSQCGTKA